MEGLELLLLLITKGKAIAGALAMRGSKNPAGTLAAPHWRSETLSLPCLLLAERAEFRLSGWNFSEFRLSGWHMFDLAGPEDTHTHTHTPSFVAARRPDLRV